MPAVLILTTAPDRRSAEKWARALVRGRWAACVSFQSGLTSIYRWKGKVEKQSEIQLVIKTSPRKFEAIRRFLEKNHPYDVPEILCLPVSAVSPAYRRWLEDQIS